MKTDEFLEKMYLNKLQPLFSEEMLVRVFKRDINKHDLSIRLKIDPETSVFRFVYSCNGESDLSNIIGALKSDLSVLDTEARKELQWRSTQFKNAIFHKTGNYINYDFDRIGVISNFAFSFGDEVIAFNDF